MSLIIICCNCDCLPYSLVCMHFGYCWGKIKAITVGSLSWISLHIPFMNCTTAKNTYEHIMLNATLIFEFTIRNFSGELECTYTRDYFSTACITLPFSMLPFTLSAPCSPFNPVLSYHGFIPKRSSFSTFVIDFPERHYVPSVWVFHNKESFWESQKCSESAPKILIKNVSYTEIKMWHKACHITIPHILDDKFLNIPPSACPGYC